MNDDPDPYPLWSELSPDDLIEPRGWSPSACVWLLVGMLRGRVPRVHPLLPEGDGADAGDVHRVPWLLVRHSEHVPYSVSAEKDGLMDRLDGTRTRSLGSSECLELHFSRPTLVA